MVGKLNGFGNRIFSISVQDLFAGSDFQPHNLIWMLLKGIFKKADIPNGWIAVLHKL